MTNSFRSLSIPRSVTQSLEEDEKKIEAVKYWKLMRKVTSGFLSSSEANEFEATSKLICRKGFIYSMTQFLSCITGLERPIKQARCVLTCFIVRFHAEEFMPTKLDSGEDDILAKVCRQTGSRIFNFLFKDEHADFMVKLDLARRLIKLYVDSFENWKRGDSVKALECLEVYYHNLKRSHAMVNLMMSDSTNEDNAEKLQTLSIIEKSCAQTLDKMAKIGGVDTMRTIKTRVQEAIDVEIANIPVNDIQLPSQFPSSSAPTSPASTTTTTEFTSNHRNDNQNFTTPERPRRRATQIPTNIRTGLANPLIPQTEANTSTFTNMDEASSVRQENQPAVFVDDDETVHVNIENIIMESASQRYWEELESQLTNQNYTRLKELLFEIRNRLGPLQSRAHQQQLYEDLDVEFIFTMIEQSSFDGHMFLGLFNTLWEQIQSIQAPCFDTAWREWKEEILQSIHSGVEWVKIVPKVFNKVLCKLDQIEDHVKMVRAAMDVAP